MSGACRCRRRNIRNHEEELLVGVSAQKSWLHWRAEDFVLNIVPGFNAGTTKMVRNAGAVASVLIWRYS